MSKIFEYAINIFINHKVVIITISISIFALLVSVISIFVAIWSWHMNRAVYDIEVKNFWIGNVSRNINKELCDIMKSGKYTVLHVSEINHGYVKVLLGRIKK